MYLNTLTGICVSVKDAETPL